MEIPNYLFFVATFADDSQIYQNPEDVSETHEGRNCYYDVLQKQKTVPLRCFVLMAEGYHPMGVDLTDGHFEVGNIPFFQHSEPYRDFRLVYFRDVKVHKTISANGDSSEGYDLGYILGWETDHKGETIQRYIRI
jgi:hypothetical protein